MSTRSLKRVLNKEIGPLTFGSFLRSARTMKGLTQQRAAELLKISKSNLCDIEKGRQNVSIELAAKIAKRLGFSEALAVECTVRDALRRAGLKIEVEFKQVG